jgi:hypothetical protein
MDKGAKKKLNPTIKSSLIFTKPNRKEQDQGQHLCHQEEGKWQGVCTQC